MKLLAHVCCASCWLACAPAWDRLLGRHRRWRAFFYNPNIHPLIEFRRRLKAVRLLAEDSRWPLLVDETYGLRRFLEEVDWRGENRCGDCYRLRLGGVAERAAELGFDHFTTTLLASVHQQQEMIRLAGEAAAQEFGLTFVAEDWRGLAGEAGAREAGEEARRRSLYRQQYCGCVFSEFERYQDTTRHLYRDPERAPGRPRRGREPQPAPPAPTESGEGGEQ